MTAPFTAEQETKLRHFEQAPPAPESCEEVVARALWDAELEQPYPWEDADDDGSREDYRRLARAALAAMQGPDAAAAAVQRVEALHRQTFPDTTALDQVDYCHECAMVWPCPTYRALRGESR